MILPTLWNGANQSGWSEQRTFSSHDSPERKASAASSCEYSPKFSCFDQFDLLSESKVFWSISALPQAMISLISSIGCRRVNATNRAQWVLSLGVENANRLTCSYDAKQSANQWSQNCIDVWEVTYCVSPIVRLCLSSPQPLTESFSSPTNNYSWLKCSILLCTYK